MIVGYHIPQNCHFILFQSEWYVFHFGSSAVLFKKTLQHFPGCSIVTVGKEADHFVMIDFFRDTRSLIHHFDYFYGAKLVDCYGMAVAISGMFVFILLILFRFLILLYINDGTIST